MRFRVFEQKALVDSIVEKGHDTSQFLFMKKHGRLRVHYDDQQPFVFFRKTVTLLDDNNQWMSVTSYDVEGPKPKQADLDWEKVVEEFNLWLMTL